MIFWSCRKCALWHQVVYQYNCVTEMTFILRLLVSQPIFLKYTKLLTHLISSVPVTHKKIVLIIAWKYSLRYFWNYYVRIKHVVLFQCYRFCSSNLTVEKFFLTHFSKYALFALQTPEGSLLDIMRNARELLSKCSIDVPMVNSLLYLAYLVCTNLFCI